MMIDADSGFAPPNWQSNIGPVVLWRENGSPVSQDDMCLLNDFLNLLLDMYPEGSAEPDEDITPFAWAEFKEDASQGYNDINI